MFWMEWIDKAQSDKGLRTGLLVQSENAGRKGIVETFWEQSQGEPDMAQAVIEFDLDNPIINRANGYSFGLNQFDHPLAPHLLFNVDPAWIPYLVVRKQEINSTAIGTILKSLLPGLEMLFSFSVLLAERVGLNSEPVDLSRLNLQRKKRGKPPLLDHIYARFDLDAPYRGKGSSNGITRGAVRLHHVRGHMVHRKGKSFWRRSHLRGDAAKPVETKTVNVVASHRT